MATRVPQQSSQSQTGVRSGAGNRGAVDDGTVFSSMREFWLWVTIVTLLIFLLFVTSIGLLHLDKKLKEANALVLRLEEKEKKNAKPRVDPEPAGSDGM